MRGMIPKAGTPMWRLLHLSEQKAARETKAAGGDWVPQVWVRSDA